MGKRNRQRRAEKAKQRGRARSQQQRQRHDLPPPWDEHEHPHSQRERAQMCLQGAAFARLEGAGEAEWRFTRTLRELDGSLVVREAEADLLRVLPLLWDHGWQPAEIVRQARRTTVRAGRLLAIAVLADHERRRPDTLHPAWAAQVAELAEATEHGRLSAGWLAEFLERERLDAVTSLDTILDTLTTCLGFGAITVLMPPPGASADTSATQGRGTTAVDDAVLTKVRALLAQAESTTFEAEAATFTAKAQALMARHAIDHALLWEQAGRDEEPITIRLPIDDPYVDAKSLLLHVVAAHSRCQAVYHERYAMSSVVGFASDVASVELLFTSLLVQSQVALQTESASAPPGSRVRSRSFRSSFLLAYARRIGERLDEVNRQVETEADEAGAESGSSLLPVLAARDDAVDEAVSSQFGELHRSSVRAGSDAVGWARGRAAADRAQLSGGDLDESTSPGDPPEIPYAASA